MTLSEFLQEKAKDESQRERFRLRDEWVEACKRMIGQFRLWLQNADSLGVLEIWTEDFDHLEERVGAYRVPDLVIRLGGTDLRVRPVSSSAVGKILEGDGAGNRLRGRIDIIGVGRKYILYRTVQEGEERWYALDMNYHSTLLDQTRFEAIVQELLS